MKRADLRLMRERLEEVRAGLIAADSCSGQGVAAERTYAFAVGRADEQLREIIARLPGAAENADRAERLAEKRTADRQAGTCDPIGGLQLRS